MADDLGQSETSDVCVDCERVFPRDRLFRCGRAVDDFDAWVNGYTAILLCIDCLYAVNPHMQRDLIEAAFDA